MKATAIAKHEVTLLVSPAEIVFLSNAINEAVEAIEDWEFQTRTGDTRTRAIEIQAQLAAIVDKATKSDG